MVDDYFGRYNDKGHKFYNEKHMDKSYLIEKITIKVC